MTPLSEIVSVRQSEWWGLPGGTRIAHVARMSCRTKRNAGRTAIALAIAIGVTSVRASADQSNDEPNGSGAPRDANVRPHCVGWAIVGGISGSVLGLAAGALAASAAGDGSLQSVGSGVSMGTGEALGATLFPIVTCKASDDPRTVPAASYLIGGAILGGGVTVVPTYLVLSATRPKSDDASLDGLVLLAAVGVGTVGGGYLGWLLHTRREPSSDTPVPATAWTALPSLSRSGAGVALYATF